MHLPNIARHKGRDLVAADKRVHVSCQSLKLAIEFFSRLNQSIIEKIEVAETAKDLGTETKLILGNALLVYELTDFIIKYIEQFQMDGLKETKDLHKQALKHIEETRTVEVRLREQANHPEIDPKLREQTLEIIQDREASIKILEDEWNNYVKSIEELERETGSVKVKLPDLRLVRENARAQIQLLEAVVMLQILRSELGAMRATMLTLGNIKLAPLSPSRVRRLLGIRQ